MNTTSIALRSETEQKIRDLIPINCTDEDMGWVTDWFLTMGLAMVKLSLLKHPELSIGDLINMTMTDKSEVH